MKQIGPKGILLPKQTGDELKVNSEYLTEEQDGIISYITEGVTTIDDIAANVQFKGLHRLNVSNGEKSWVRLEPSGLEKVRHNGKIGYRLVGSSPEYYTGLGHNAIDFSIGNKNVSQAGAEGNYSIILGQSETDNNHLSAKGDYSVMLGNRSNVSSGVSLAEGKYSIVIGGGIAISENSMVIGGGIIGNERAIGAISIGEESQAGGEYSMAIGPNLPKATGKYSMAIATGEATGNNSIAIGGRALGNSSIAIGGTAKNSGEIALGDSNFSTDTTPHTNFDDTKAQLFSIGSKYGGNKTNSVNLEGNAMVVLRDGSTGISLPIDKATPENSKPTEMLDVGGNIRIRGANYEDAVIHGEKCPNLGVIHFNESDGNFYGCTGKPDAKVWKKLNSD